MSIIKNLSLKNAIIVIVATIFLVQIISLLLTSVVPSIPVLKGGSAILLIFLLIAIISLFVLAINFEQLKQRENLLFIIIVFGVVILAYWKLESFLPQIFSIEPQISKIIQQTIGSVFGG